MRELTDEDRELSRALKLNIEGVIAEMGPLIPRIDFSEPIDSSKVKLALLDVTPEGLQKLYAEFGEQAVLEFINEFAAGKEWG